MLADGQCGSQVLAHDIRDSVRASLTAHKFSGAIECIDELPLNSSGKVGRVELRELELARQVVQ